MASDKEELPDCRACGNQGALQMGLRVEFCYAIGCKHRDKWEPGLFGKLRRKGDDNGKA